MRHVLFFPSFFSFSFETLHCTGGVLRQRPHQLKHNKQITNMDDVKLQPHKEERQLDAERKIKDETEAKHYLTSRQWILINFNFQILKNILICTMTFTLLLLFFVFLPNPVLLLQNKHKNSYHISSEKSRNIEIINRF